VKHTKHYSYETSCNTDDHLSTLYTKLNIWNTAEKVKIYYMITQFNDSLYEVTGE